MPTDMAASDTPMLCSVQGEELMCFVLYNERNFPEKIRKKKHGIFLSVLTTRISYKNK
ncbi:hypothetical protein HanXRQr2_Chr14g0625041 [Helianthus annuus]|uniref:Uncharacterized protein n=1 Tax=Helianthus annuus TaxID=4232 RepID=A0A9K3H651_HELAN|nr:hypothetical protein HanXRQr2_Chr14g0625041 [Helianthus annuus]KAJ0838871.1 hypothetical protein HanPSC8_Chr14g0599821 [Helianthus annuus]